MYLYISLVRLSADELLVAMGSSMITVKFSTSEGTMRIVSSLPSMHEVKYNL